MKQENKKETIELLIFFGITFGVNFLIGIPMYFYHYISTEVFAFLIMLLPAGGAILAKRYRKEHKKEDFVINRVMLAGLILFLLLTLLTALKICSEESASQIITAIIFIASIGILLYSIFRKNGTPVLDKGNLIHKDFVFLVVVLFARNILSVIPELAEGRMESLGRVVMAVFLIFESFLSIFVLYGEEYGWRGYLQGKLQKRFGKKIGVLILGILWWCWHLPLWMTQGDRFPELLTAGLPIVLGVSVFLGYIYLRTGNVWLCAIAHGIYNSMARGYVTGNSGIGEIVANVSQLLVAVVLLLYLRKREYYE